MARTVTDDAYVSLPVAEFEALHERIRTLEAALKLHVQTGHDTFDHLQRALEQSDARRPR